MLFTPEHQEDLGPAYVVLDGDSLYIRAKKWIIVASSANHVFAPERVEDIKALQGAWSSIDWLILTAKEVDLSVKKFLPARGRKFQDVNIRSGNYWGAASEGASSIRKTVEDAAPSLYADGLIDLSAKFRDGKAAVIYPEREKGEFCITPTADRYVFTEEGRVIVVDAAPFLAFVEMGFQITCPRNRMGTRVECPPLGLYMDWNGVPVFGVLYASDSGSGISTDRKGRALFVDPATNSWLTPEECRDLLQAPTEYLPGKNINQMLQDSHNLRRAVSGLRWNGLLDEQIVTLYEDNRYAAYSVIYENAIRRAADLDAYLTDDVLENGDSWRLKGFLNEAKRLKALIENIQKEVGDQISYGHLETIIEKLEAA